MRTDSKDKKVSIYPAHHALTYNSIVRPLTPATSLHREISINHRGKLRNLGEQIETGEYGSYVHPAVETVADCTAGVAKR